jgi:GAF domain-containing protein
VVTDEAWARDRQRFVQDVGDALVEHPAPLRDHGYRLGPLAMQFATLTNSLLDATTVADVLEQVVRAAEQVVPEADLVSVTLIDQRGQFHTAVTTDPTGSELDQLQYRFGEGPCVEAAREDGPAVACSADVAVEPAWPRFGPAAAALGARSVLSTALLTAPAHPGALNLYCRRPRGFTDEDQHVALLLATHASLALAHTHAVEIGRLKETNLRRAIDSRDVIGMAKGILMNRQGVDPAGAFDILRRVSQDLNVKLAEVANTLVSRHSEIDS